MRLSHSKLEIVDTDQEMSSLKYETVEKTAENPEVYDKSGDNNLDDTSTMERNVSFSDQPECFSAGDMPIFDNVTLGKQADVFPDILLAGRVTDF